MTEQEEREGEREAGLAWGDSILSAADHCDIQIYTREEVEESYIESYEDAHLSSHDFEIPWPWNTLTIREVFKQNETLFNDVVNDYVKEYFVEFDTSEGTRYIREDDLEECTAWIDDFHDVA